MFWITVVAALTNNNVITQRNEYYSGFYDGTVFIRTMRCDAIDHLSTNDKFSSELETTLICGRQIIYQPCRPKKFFLVYIRSSGNDRSSRHAPNFYEKLFSSMVRCIFHHTSIYLCIRIVTQIKLIMNITWRRFIDLRYRRENRISIITWKPHAFQLKDYLRTSKLAYTFYGYDTYALYERTNCTWYSYTFRLFTSPEQHRKSSSARYLETNLRSIWLFFCQSVLLSSLRVYEKSWFVLMYLWYREIDSFPVYSPISKGKLELTQGNKIDEYAL